MALYDVVDGGDVVYVGVSTVPRGRMHDHYVLRRIPRTATQHILRWYDNRDEAELAEYERIRLLCPKFNIENNPSAARPKTRCRTEFLVIQSSVRIDLTKKRMRRRVRSGLTSVSCNKQRCDRGGAVVSEIIEHAVRVAERLTTDAHKLPPEVLRINADTAAIVIEIDGVDYILTMARVPMQRVRPATQ